MAEKIANAVRYCASHVNDGDSMQVRNDAANIFADNYEEYEAIWAALDGGEFRA